MKPKTTYFLLLMIVLTLLLLTGRSIIDHYFLKEGKVYLSYDIALQNKDTLEIFYNDGSGWDPNKKVQQVFSPDQNSFQHVEFPAVKQGHIESFRFDFGRNNKKVTLRNVFVKIVGDEQKLFLNPNKLQANCLAVTEKRPGFFAATITCDDPYVIENSKLMLNSREMSLGDIMILVVYYAIFGVISLILFRKKPFYRRFGELNKFSDIVFITGFLVIVSVHWIMSLFGMSANNFSLEKRIPEPLPKWNDTAFVQHFQSWFDDNFALRQPLTRTRSLAYYYLFKKSALPEKVLIGKNLEMFPAVFFLTDDYSGKCMLSEAQLYSIRKNIRERIDYCQQQGKSYYLLLAPNKQSVYPQDMPKPIYAHYQPAKTMLNQLLQYLKKDSVITSHLISTESELSKIALLHPEQRIFHQNDLHWNGLGAFYAYRLLMKKLMNQYPLLQPYSESDFHVEIKKDNQGDLSRMLLLNDYALRPMSYFTLKQGTPFQMEEVFDHYTKATYITRQSNSKLPRLLVFRDSYSQDLIQFLSLHFSEATYIWNQEFDIGLIQEKQPDIVLQEIAELFLYDLLRLNPKKIQHEI